MADDTTDDPRDRLPSAMDIPASARRAAQYGIRIVQAATAAGWPGQRFDSAVRCRRRPGRKPCPGHLQVMLVEVPEQVRWRCSHCGDAGVITGWKGAPWDLSCTLEAHTGTDDEIALTVSRDVYRVIDDVFVLDPEAERVVKAAETVDDGVRLSGSLDELELLVEGLASEANHEPNRRRARLLERACDLLDAVV